MTLIDVPDDDPTSLRTGDIHSLMDVSKVADSLIFVLDSTDGWDGYGDHCLSCLFAQGLPSYGEWKRVGYRRSE